MKDMIIVHTIILPSKSALNRENGRRSEVAKANFSGFSQKRVDSVKVLCWQIQTKRVMRTSILTKQ